jgi:N-acetyl-alpha-D-muramate 1-phosphate uridylyltransferase
MIRMKVMILAAGLGRRLAPLTDSVPKPLLEIGGTTLIERHLVRLAADGFDDVVVNLAHLGELIAGRLGDGRRYGVRIAYSRESDGPLETGGGIANALPLLGSAPFAVVNADIWTDFPFATLRAAGHPAHVVLVPNPADRADGDFTLRGKRVERGRRNTATYAGIGVFDPALFARPTQARFPLAPLLFELAATGRLAGELYTGRWFDIGTPARLASARAQAEPAPHAR